jgi:hypothetical protein
VAGLHKTADGICQVILDARGGKDEHKSDVWYSEETKINLRQLKVDTHLTRLGHGTPSREGRGH